MKVEVNREKKMTPEEQLLLLQTKARQKLVNFDIDESKLTKPEWLDEVKLEHAQKIIRKFLLGVEFSSLTGLLLIVQSPDALEPLLSTGQSRDIPSLCHRYVSTILHCRRWYETNLLDSNSAGYKSVRTVRQMHKRLQNNMNEKFTVPDVDGKPGLWFTHYDVALTQFSFVGFAILYPEKCGLIAATDEELCLINYYWRYLGHLMGVEDEFNCYRFETIDDIRTFLKLVLEQEIKPRLYSKACPTGLAMSQGICLALADYISLVTFNSLAHWWKDVIKFNGYELKPMNLKERTLTKINKVAFNNMFKYTPLLKVSTKLHQMRFDRKLKSRTKIEEKLKTKYTGDEYTYLSDRYDYLNTGLCKRASNQCTDVKGNGNCPLGFKMATSVNDEIKVNN